MSPIRILWFGVSAGIVPSFQLEASLAQGLALMGDEVTRIACDGLFAQYCPVMQNEQLLLASGAAEKKRVCRACRSISGVAQQDSSYQTLLLDDFIQSSDKSVIDEIMASVTPQNWRDLRVDGLDIGRHSTYVAMLIHKLTDVSSSDASWLEYVVDLKNALLTYYALPAIFDRVDPTHAMLYNPLYPSNRVFTELSLRRGLQLISLSAGGFVPARTETLAIYPHISASQTMVDSPSILNSLTLACSAEEIAAVEEHLVGLIAGQDPWVYSSAPKQLGSEETRLRLGISRQAPIVLALVSSPDETRSYELVDADFDRVPREELSDVREFVQVAIDVAWRNPDLDVVIRLHPRLAPNKRESMTSPDLAKILDMFVNLPPNCFVNGPGDGLGLYDVMQIATLGLNQSSSSGLELLTYGIPVVHYDPPRLNAYPPQLGPQVERGNSRQLDTAIWAEVHKPNSNQTMAFRWYAVTLLRSLVHRKPVGGSGSDPSFLPAKSLSRGPYFRKVLPDNLRFRIARWQSLRRERRQVLPVTYVQPWVLESRERILALGSGPIWNPQTHVRGSSLISDSEAIADVIKRLKTRLGWAQSLK